MAKKELKKKPTYAEHLAAWAKDISGGKDPIAWTLDFIDGLVHDLDSGKVTPYDSKCWYLMYFVMTYKFDNVLSLEATNCSLFERAMQEFLTAAAALAKRINSLTYDTFADLLADLKFRGGTCGQKFSAEDYPPFDEARRSALKRLWADNEVYRYNQYLQAPRKNTPKKA